MGAVVLLLTGTASCMPPSWGAAALLHPARRGAQTPPGVRVEDVDLEGDGVILKGWWFRASGATKGTVVYLHGVGDNRASSAGIAARYVPRGFDVIAYDSRAHGDSQGEACTYGFYEKRDLARVLTKVVAKPVILLGSSLGAAVALQTAAEDSRVAAVVAVAAFSDLRTAVNERAPSFASDGNIRKALLRAEKDGRFRVDDVSPVNAAGRISVPTVIVHGERDQETPPAHSRRIFAALRGPKQLILVPGRGHHDSLTPEVWRRIDEWLADLLTLH